MEALVSEYRLSLSLKIFLVYCISTTLSLTSYCVFFCLSVSRALSHYAHCSVCFINMMRRSFATIFCQFLFLQSFSLHCFSLWVIHCLISTMQLQPPHRHKPPHPSVLKGTCQALPLKGVHRIYCLPPSVSSPPVFPPSQRGFDFLVVVLKSFIFYLISLTHLKTYQELHLSFSSRLCTLIVFQ